jgi:hypothetical protein
MGFDLYNPQTQCKEPEAPSLTMEGMLAEIQAGIDKLEVACVRLREENRKLKAKNMDLELQLYKIRND